MCRSQTGELKNQIFRVKGFIVKDFSKRHNIAVYFHPKAFTHSGISFSKSTVLIQQLVYQVSIGLSVVVIQEAIKVNFVDNIFVYRCKVDLRNSISLAWFHFNFELAVQFCDMKMQSRSPWQKRCLKFTKNFVRVGKVGQTRSSLTSHKNPSYDLLNLRPRELEKKTRLIRLLHPHLLLSFKYITKRYFSVQKRKFFLALNR